MPVKTTQNSSKISSPTKKRLPLKVKVATQASELEAAQKLRAKCFGDEFGLTFENNIDKDKYDDFCEHLLVYDGDLLVATTRMMTRDNAERLGEFYTQHEFDLSTVLSSFSDNIIEIGRSCVHTDYRDIHAVNTLWQGIGSVAKKYDAKALMGCASIPIGNGNTQMWIDEKEDSQKVSVTPYIHLPPSDIIEQPTIPALLKTYVRMGSQIGDVAFYDADFKCADVFIWFPLDLMNVRSQQRFLQQDVL